MRRGICGWRTAVGLDHRLYLGVPIPSARTLFKNQIGAHAAAGEVAYAVVVLRPVRVRIEVTRPVVANVLEELHEPERRLEIRGAEAEILIVAAGHLIVQVDVEQLAGFP